jgi:hypothetical protein
LSRGGFGNPQILAFAQQSASFIDKVHVSGIEIMILGWPLQKNA